MPKSLVKGISIILFAVITMPAFAQEADENSSEEKAQIDFEGFLDIFYAYDFNKPVTDFRQPFHFHFNRHNEFNINLGLIRTSVSHSKYRANLGFQVGTYAIDNYAAEDEVLRHVFEANAGVALNQNGNLWLDVGLFGSHLGFESAISMENMTLTRSLAAENSPYFLTGAKLTYEPNDSWSLGFTVANGWQRIRRVPGNSMPSIGTQVSYNLNENITLNWSTLVGTDDPDVSRRVRVFNNLYGIFQLTERMKMIAGFDFGTQEAGGSETGSHTWSTSALILQYQLADRWAMAFRAEHFKDDNEVIVASASGRGFSVLGFSLNLDYQPEDNVLCRLETRLFRGEDDFIKDQLPANDNFAIVGSIAIRWKD